MPRRIEPWEIPAHARASVGRVLDGLADWFQARANSAEREADNPRNSNPWDWQRQSLILDDTAAELRSYAADILSWSEVSASSAQTPTPNTGDPYANRNGTGVHHAVAADQGERRRRPRAVSGTAD
jgi:hypothetical protein